MVDVALPQSGRIRRSSSAATRAAISSLSTIRSGR